MNSYRGITYYIYGTGYIVELDDDEIYCDRLDAVYATIDEHLDGEEV